MALYVGSSGDLIYDSTSLCVREWSADVDAPEIDTTTKCSGGFHRNETGIKTCTISGSGFWDSTINNTDPPTPTVGESVVCTLEIVSGGDGITGTFRVTSMSFTSAVDGVLEYEFSAVSNGQFYLPGETAS
jgi:hypothetical protein